MQDKTSSLYKDHIKINSICDETWIMGGEREEKNVY